MTIKDILKNTALIIGRSNISEYLTSGNATQAGADAVETVKTLTALANLVINELSCTYIPMVKVENIAVNDGKIYYTDLSETVLRIKDVYSVYGKAVPFKETASYIAVDLNAVEIEYEYAPKTFSIDEEIGYSEKDVPSRVLSYGVAAELAISEGRFDEAVTFHKRYVDGVSEVVLPKNVRVKKRSFI